MRRVSAILLKISAVILAASQCRADSLLWADNTFNRADGTGDIQRARLDGSGQTTLISGIDPYGIAADPLHGKMYWGDYVFDNSDFEFPTGTINRANLDGSGQEIVIDQQIFPVGVALDASAGQVYWIAHAQQTSPYGKDIRRANFDGSDQQTLVHTAGVAGNGQLALDLAGGKIYTTDFGENRIRRFNLDGSGGMTLIGGLNRPVGIALDLPAGKIYWADYGDNGIYQANLDGSGKKLLVQANGPSGLVLDLAAGTMYWTDAATVDKGDIRSANLDGSNVQVLVTDLPDPFSIALIPLLGDANRDGKVDFSDLLVMAQHYGLPGGATRGDGDFNGDGKVDFNDLLILAQHYGATDTAPAPAAVPEPSLLVLLGLSVTVIPRRRRTG